MEGARLEVEGWGWVFARVRQALPDGPKEAFVVDPAKTESELLQDCFHSRFHELATNKSGQFTAPGILPLHFGP